MSNAREKVIFLHLHKTGGLSMNIVLNRQYVGQRGAIIHADVHARIRELIALPQDKRDQLVFLSGHFFFRIHEIWSSPASYFTLIREPIARAHSNYHFLGIIPRGIANPALRGEFENYMRSPKQATYLIRRIAGYKPGQPGIKYEDSEITDSERLGLAEMNLRRMKVVGLTEEFDKTLLLLRQALGWRNIYYVRRNTTAEKGRTLR